MEQSRYHHQGPYGQPDGQPGLEAVNWNQPDLEVAAHERLQHDHLLPEALHHHSVYAGTGKESAALSYSSAYPEHYTPVGSHPPYGAGELAITAQTPRRKRLWIAIGVLVAVIVILAAVLGGVFGSRAANASSGDETSPQTGGDSGDSDGAGDADSTATGDAPSPTTTNPPPVIRQGSGLSVAGWRRPDGSVETFLFYQDPQDGLRYSRSDTNDRTQGNESTRWGSPISFGGDFVKPGTHLGATAFILGDKHKVSLTQTSFFAAIPNSLLQPQLEIFYTGFETRLLGISINNQLKPNTTDDSINQVDINTSPDTDITALWPWIIYQDASGGLIHTRNRVQGENRSPSSNWDVNKLNLKALAGSRLSMTPMLTDFGRLATKGGYAIFYQAPDSQLATHITDLDSDQLDEEYPLSWPTTLPAITLPKLAPIAAFSVARAGGDELGRVDTYVLYLDGDADINVLYTDSWSGSEVEWKTARPEALRGVDEDTDIACLNMPSSRKGAEEKPVLLEEVEGDTARCYFQRGGEVVEVRLDAEGGEREWVEVGVVPMG